MKLQNAIKKVAALSTGAAMLGASVLGAVAYDLSNYPEPFVKNGQFNGVLVVGEKAATSDVIGVTDIAMSLQASAVVEETVAVEGQTTQTVVEGGAEVAAGGDGVLLGQQMSALKPSFTEDDLDLLKPTVMEDNDGNTYDVEYKVTTPNAAITFGSDIYDLTSPEFYVDFTGGETWDFEIKIPEGVNVDDMRGESIEILGEEYTFGEGDEVNQSAKLVTLYKAGVDKTFNQEDGEVTVQVGDREVRVEILGGLSDDRTAVISINGESQTVEEGRSYTLGGERVYVKDVQLLNIPTPHAAVRLFLGAEKIILEDGKSVKMGADEETVDGTTVHFSTSGSLTTAIKVTYEPNAHDPEVEGVLMGESYVDPVFHGLKWDFTSMTPALDSDAREEIELYPSSTDKLSLKFTSYAGDDYNLVVFRAADSQTELRYGSRAAEKYLVENNWDGDASGAVDSLALAEDNRFILVTPGNPSGEYARVLEIVNIDNTSSPKLVTVRDVATGNERDVTLSDTADETATLGFDGDVTLSETGFEAGTFSYDGYDYGFVLIEPSDSANVSEAMVVLTNPDYSAVMAAGDYLVSKQGAKIIFPTGTYNLDATTTNDDPIFQLEEDTDYTEATPATGIAGTWTFAVNYDNTRTGNEIRVSSVTVPNANTKQDQAEDSDVVEYMSQYGTYVKYDTADSGYDVKIYFYGKDTTQYHVFLAPVSAGTTTTGGEGSVVTEKVQRINVGAAKLDSEVQDLVGQENMIVVGGPCANSVAAELMGNPEQCTAGFEEGKAMIKAFDHDSGAVSILVAGYSAQDTRLASQVLANYEDYRDQLKGSEVIVEGTSINNVVISAPAQE